MANGKWLMADGKEQGAGSAEHGKEDELTICSSFFSHMPSAIRSSLLAFCH